MAAGYRGRTRIPVGRAYTKVSLDQYCLELCLILYTIRESYLDNATKVEVASAGFEPAEVSDTTTDTNRAPPFQAPHITRKML